MAKKRSEGSKHFIILVILFIMAAGLWLVLQHTREAGIFSPQDRKYQLQKTGAGITVDFTGASRRLDEIICQAVKDSGFKNVIAERQQREVPRKQVEGFIKWENRQITIAAPTEAQRTDFLEKLSGLVRNAGGRVFDRREDMLAGKQALRVDIGFEDTLEGEPVTVVTHNIWVTVQTDNPAAPPKADDELYGTKPPPADTAKPPAGSKLPPGKQLGRLALVIDDCGLTMEGIADLLAVEQPITFSILPYHQYSTTIAREATARGKQVMLHLPLESIGGEWAEPTTITTAMTEEQIRRITREAVEGLPQIVGVNNHQGSKATADARVMKAVLAVLREKGLFFLDSRTSSGSVAYHTAKSMGMRAAENELFIDNSADENAIKQELRAAGRLAVVRGEAVAIGHIRPHTVAAIRDMLPELEAMGVKLVFVSELAG